MRRVYLDSIGGYVLNQVKRWLCERILGHRYRRDEDLVFYEDWRGHMRLRSVPIERCTRCGARA